MCGLICSMFVASVWKHTINAPIPCVKVTCFCGPMTSKAYPLVNKVVYMILNKRRARFVGAEHW